MSTALATIEKITAVEFFKPGASKSIIDSLKQEARDTAATFDVSTSAGEAGLRSLAAQIGKAKQRIDKARIDLVADEKKRLKVIDTEGGVVWDELEALQKEVRQPLTDKEEAEKKRVFQHEANLAELVGAGNHAAQNWQNLSVEALRDRLKEITNSEYDWQELLGRAKVACVTSIGQIREAITRREKMDADAAELEALRAAQAKRAQEEHEAAIAQAAKDAADAAARKREEEQRAAAEAERLRIEAERVEAEARAKQAEALRVAAEEKAKREAQEAEERLLAEQQRAREADAQRVEAKERAAREAELAEKRRLDDLAAERERAEAEAKAASERMARARKEDAERLAAAQAKAKADMEAATVRAEQERKDAELRAEAARKAAIMVAESNAKKAAEKAEADRLAAVEAERQRAAEEQRKAQEEATKRENNRKHAAKINNEAKDALMKVLFDAGLETTISDVQATAIIVAIAKGLIPHTKISY